jgi:hypothetical protein
MPIIDIWTVYGFKENPYSNQTLPPDEVGDYLLAGRDEEVAKIQRRIASGSTHPSVEGLRGLESPV